METKIVSFQLNSTFFSPFETILFYDKKVFVFEAGASSKFVL